MRLPIFAAVFVLLALVFLTAWFLFRKAFCHPRCRDLSDESTLLHSEWFSYAALLEPALKWFNSQNWRECKTTAKDGTELQGLWLPRKDSRTALLLFHDYCGGPQDLSLFAKWGYKRGFSIFVAYERGHGKSEGKFCSLGILEAGDCAAWARTIREMEGSDVKLILCGCGMGATAVMLSVNEGIQDTASLLICDSPVPSIQELLKRVIRGQLHMQVFPMLQLLCLYGRLIWGKSHSEAELSGLSPELHTLPVFFAAGKQSRIIPWKEIKRTADAYFGPKKLFCSDLAGHTAASLAEYEAYFQELDSFLDQNGIN